MSWNPRTWALGLDLPLGRRSNTFESPTPTPSGPPPAIVIGFEAESGVIVPAMIVASDAVASNDQYVVQKTTSGAGYATYSMVISVAGAYQLKGKP